MTTAWGYGPENGPERWADLSAEFELCRLGEAQSPIDLADAVPADLPPIRCAYEPVRPTIIAGPGTLMVECPGSGHAVIDGTSFELLQFHFHTPSEHALEGRLLDGEVHLVHRGRDGSTAVIGVLLARTPGMRHPGLAAVLRELPSPGASPEARGTIDPSDFIPGDRGYFRYEGSLTTPPCTEGVLWSVMRTAAQVSPGQVAALGAVTGVNSRPVQPRHGRPLTFGGFPTRRSPRP